MSRVILTLIRRIEDYAEARRRFNGFLSPSVASAMFNSTSVYAAPISGVMTPDLFLRFGDAGASIDEWLEGPSVSKASLISDIPRLVLAIRLLCEVAGESSPRGVEVTFLGGRCRYRYVSR